MKQCPSCQLSSAQPTAATAITGRRRPQWAVMDSIAADSNTAAAAAVASKDQRGPKRAHGAKR